MNNIEPQPKSARISRDWPGFAERLASVLSGMEEDQFLIISDKNSKRYVQFAAQGAFGMRAEISSNAYLPRPDHFSDGQMARLTEAGWLPPTGTPEESTPGQDPDGSPNFFIQCDAPIDAPRIAEQAVNALVEVFGIPYPGFLTYHAFDHDDNGLTFPELGLQHVSPADKHDRQKIAKRLLGLVREITSVDTLDFDEDGDVGISFDATTTFIRLVGNPPYARLWAPLMHGVAESPALLARLNALNASTGHLRFFVTEGTVFAVADVPANPLNRAHLTAATERFCEIANGMAQALQAEFDGKADASGCRSPSPIH